MSKRLSKYIASFDYFDKSLIVLSAANHSISMASFSTVIGAPVEIVNAIFSVAFSVSTGIVKKLLKEHEIKKKKRNKIVMLAGSKSSSIESKSPESLTNNEISHEDFMPIIKEKRSYGELKESSRMMKSQERNTEKIILIEEDKKIDIGEVIKCHESVNNSLKSQIKKALLSYCLKGRKNSENINPKVLKIKNFKTMILLKCAMWVVKNQNIPLLGNILL